MSEARILPFSDLYQRYLRDESSEEGFAESISFPRSEEDVIQILHNLHGKQQEEAVTCQGSRTGIRGLAVPHGGHILNCEKMNRILKLEAVSEEEAYALVEPGVTLKDLNLAIARTFREPAYFWPPSPTETSATIAGIAVTGACGMNTCHYGATSGYISEISKTQSGVITKLKLRLIRRPDEIWGAAFFFDQTEDALKFGDLLRCSISRETSGTNEIKDHGDAWIASMEFFDETALALASARKAELSGGESIPEIPAGAKSLIYIEVEGIPDEVENSIFELMEPAEACGCDPDRMLAFAGRSETEKMHRLRHAVLEAVSDYAARRHSEDTRITRLTFDFSDGGKRFSEQAENILKGLKQCDLTAAVLAHIREAAFEINILPGDYGSVLRSRTFSEEVLLQTTPVQIQEAL